MAKHEELRYRLKVSDALYGLARSALRLLLENKYLVAIVVFSLTPLVWFRPWNTLITSGDFWLPVGAADMWRSLFSSWLPNISGGQTNNTVFEIFPWVSFWAFFKLLSFSLSSTEKIWFVTMFLLGGVSVYLLTFEVFRNKEAGWKNFIPSLFYLFNLYIMMVGVTTTNLLVYMINPLFLLLYIRSTHSSNIFRSAIILGLVTILFTSTAGNPPMYTIPFLTIGIFFFFLIIFKRLNVRFVLFNILFAFFYLLFNFWWIYFYVQNILSQVGTLKDVAGASTIGGGSHFYDVLRLLGSWAFFAGHLGFPYFPFANSYLNPVLMFLTFLIPVLVWAGFYLRRKKDDPLIIFFAILGIVGLLLSHGQEQDFFGQINSLITKFVPFFWIYREPYAKFSTLTAISYAILLGSLFSFLESKLQSSRAPILIALLVSALILTVSWPLVIGDHFPGKRGILAPSRKTIPQYWFDITNWFKGKESDGRVFILPDNPEWNRSGIPYTWGYDSADLVPFLLTAPWIERNNGYYVEALMENMSNVSSQAYKTFNEVASPVRSLTPVLQLLNVNRLLQRNDVDLVRVGPLADNYSPAHIRQVISQQPDLSLEKTFGALDVYRLKPNKVWGKFYTAQKIDCLLGNADSLVYPTDFFGVDTKVAVFSPKDTENTIINYCNTNFVAPVELTKTGPYFTSVPFRPNFSSKPTTVTLDLGPVSQKYGKRAHERYFAFQVPRKGTYEVFLEKRQNISYENPSSLFSLLRVDNLTTALKPLGFGEVSPKPLSLSTKFDLDAGPHLLIYDDPAKFNLVEDSSFENVPWGTTFSKVPPALSNESFDGSKSMELGTGVVDAYYSIPKDKLEPRNYVFSFFYKVKSGATPTFFVWENNCDKDMPLWTRLDVGDDPNCHSSFAVQPPLSATPNWAEYKSEYTPSLNSKRIGIGFVFLDGNQRVFSNTGQTLIDNLFLTPKLSGGIIIKSQEDAAPAEALGNPPITIIKHSPTQYILSVSQAKNPYFLVFSETFNKDWQLMVKRPLGSIPPVSTDHFIVNGYANAWYISETGNYQIEITYLPESKFRLFLLSSVLFIVGAVLYLINLKFHFVKFNIPMFKSKSNL